MRARRVALPPAPTNRTWRRASHQRRPQKWHHLDFEEIPQPDAASYQRPQPRRVAGTQLLQQPDRAEAVTVAKLRHSVFPNDKFRAPAADVQNEHGRPGQFRVGRDASENPVGFLIPGNDFQLETATLAYGLGQFAGVWASRAALVAMSRSDVAPSSWATWENSFTASAVAAMAGACKRRAV